MHAGALASPTHTGEGAEGRREGGEKAAEEGDGRKKIRQRERRGREMRGGASDLENIGRERETSVAFCPGHRLHPGQKAPFCPGW